MAINIGHLQKVFSFSIYLICVCFAYITATESILWNELLGHVDPGEDDFTTALRETQEEAGYTTDDLNIYKDQQKILNYKVKGNDKTVVYWLAELRAPQKNPILSDEHTEFRWLMKDEAISLSGYADFAEMVRHFHDKMGSL